MFFLRLLALAVAFVPVAGDGDALGAPPLVDMRGAAVDTGHGVTLAQTWLWFIGMNLAFFPMHFIGLLGQPRRTYTYSPELGVTGMNQLATVGAYLMAVAFLVYVWNLVRSLRRGEPAGPNPWGAATLEWATTSPPPLYNFGRIPVIRNREPLWLEGADEVVEAAQARPGNFHMPPPSFWPILTAASIALTLILFMTHHWWAPVIGLALTILCVMNFAMEPTA